MSELKSGAINIHEIPKSQKGFHDVELDYDAIQNRYAIAIGKGACVLDKDDRALISASDLSVTIGNELKTKFVNDPRTERISKENIVFDPGCTGDINGVFNLFRGIQVKPVKGDCSKILQLLLMMCENNQLVFDWVVNWLAYPLQNLGAKMRSAMVVHGGEGVGKNLFLSTLERIYGEYSAIITQTDIESDFNGWASCKLFVIGNEVVSRQEMYHKKGVIKNMITEPFWNINEKNISPRREANHANFVFTSNHLQPVSPDKDDRRYLILWTPPKMEKEFYRGVAKERDNGGVEAFFYYLLNKDLREFDEYSEPVSTKAKNELILLSMKSDQKFITHWLDGDLPVQVMTCLSDDLYKFYLAWCKRVGEKFTVTLTEFGTRIGKCDDQLMKMNNQRYRVGAREHKGTFVFHIDTSDKPDDITKIDWLTGCRKAFQDDVNDWVDSSDA